jgi:integrase
MAGSAHQYTLTSGETRWKAVYRRPDNTQTSKSGFRRKRDALEFLATVTVSKASGTYVSPHDAKALVSALGADWLVGHAASVKPSTLHSDESAWRIHVLPKWGDRPVGSIRHSEVVAWAAGLAGNRSATTVRRAHGILAAILDNAVRDRRIPSNPARDIKLPRRTQSSRGYLTHQQVEYLAFAAKYAGLVRFLALTGLRWGEATGLRVKHLDMARRRASIEENAVWVNGKVEVGTPKSHERRTVVWPEVLDDDLKAAIAGKRRDSLVWGITGLEYLQPSHSEHGWFASAVRSAQAKDDSFPYITPHDLRHTAASLAISAGANVKAVQRMLGHRSAAMTLDKYADLFEDDLDDVAQALSAAHLRATPSQRQNSNRSATELP